MRSLQANPSVPSRIPIKALHVKAKTKSQPARKVSPIPRSIPSSHSIQRYFTHEPCHVQR